MSLTAQPLPSASDLRYFLEVSHTLNVTRAAERLGIAQPSLSQALKRLEDALGAPVLVRGKSGVQLTHAGRKLASRARDLLEEWEKLRRETARDEREIRGRYVIGAHPAVALYTLERVLPALLKDHPGLEISLAHDLSRKILEDVVSFKVDFGLVMNPVKHPDLVLRRLFSDEVSVWTAAAPSALQDHRTGDGVLIYDPALGQSQTVLAGLSRAACSPPAAWR
jgi:LysR family transcriptional regulator, cell division regulator